MNGKWMNDQNKVWVKREGVAVWRMMMMIKLAKGYSILASLYLSNAFVCSVFITDSHCGRFKKIAIEGIRQQQNIRQARAHIRIHGLCWICQKRERHTRVYIIKKQGGFTGGVLNEVKGCHCIQAQQTKPNKNRLPKVERQSSDPKW